jgi:hypothetical protein
LFIQPVNPEQGEQHGGIFVEEVMTLSSLNDLRFASKVRLFGYFTCYPLSDKQFDEYLQVQRQLPN